MPAESQKKSPQKFDRRGLLAGSAGAAGLLLLGAWGSAEGEPHLVRPPGSVSPEGFLARCLRCDRCRSVCHTNVIGAGKLSDGILALRTPVMDFMLGFCDFCEKCAEVAGRAAIPGIGKTTFSSEPEFSYLCQDETQGRRGRFCPKRTDFESSSQFKDSEM